MKVLKPVYITGAIALALIGCKSVVTIPVPKGTDNVVNIIAKKMISVVFRLLFLSINVRFNGIGKINPFFLRYC